MAKQWKDYTPRQKKIYKIVVSIILGLLLLVIFIAAISDNSKSDNNKNETNKSVTEHPVAEKVKKVLDGLDEDTRSSLASTSAGGYQGDIISVESDGNDGVKVKVSTYFKESGDENDGGKNIAHNIFSTVCLDVQELESLYVVSDSSGLESRSVYRSDVPACNN